MTTTERFPCAAIFLAVSATCAFWSSLARADVVPPPPTDCVDGTQGSSCHGGTYCQPSACSTSAECAKGQTCASRSFCATTVDCFGGFVVDGGAQDYAETSAGAVCAGASDCSGGGTCKSFMVCVDTSSSSTADGGTASASDTSGCSCRMERGGTAWMGLVAVAVGCGLVASRKRQRPSRHRRA